MDATKMDTTKNQKEPGPGSAPGPAAIWSTGDYADVCDRMIPALGARLVELAGARSGEAVLDVACGSGNASLPAARAGATVTALDITPQLLAAGARRAAAAGLAIAWTEGDAQAMPFADATFDRVLSCVGVQFCADQAAAAAELVRVCRPGGRIALIAWTPEGFIGRVLAAVGAATGAAGRGPSPLAWGTEEGVAALLGPRAGEILCHREQVTMGAASPAAWVDYMAEAYGPLTRAHTLLAERGAWAELRERLIAIAVRYDTGAAGTFAAPAEYLVTLADRPGAGSR